MNPRGNPNLKAGPGRPKENLCTKTKNDFFKAYFKLGGLKNLMHLFEDRKWFKACGTNYPRGYDQKFCKCGELVKLIPGELRKGNSSSAKEVAINCKRAVWSDRQPEKPERITRNACGKATSG